MNYSVTESALSMPRHPDWVQWKVIFLPSFRGDLHALHQPPTNWSETQEVGMFSVT